jgi:hypothetical protein
MEQEQRFRIPAIQQDFLPPSPHRAVGQALQARQSLVESKVATIYFHAIFPDRAMR